MTAISSNRADKKAEKLLEREIARKKRKLQKTTAFDVFNIIFLLILAFIVIVPFYSPSSVPSSHSRNSS